MTVSSLPPTSSPLRGDYLLAKLSVLHHRLRFAQPAQLERTRAEIARLHTIGRALENAARAKCGMPPMDEP